MILGYLFALLGALSSGGGSVLESLGVQRAGAYGGDSGELGKVARQPLYWAGVTADLVGFASAAAALQKLPLFLVQTVMAFSVGVTAAISAALGVELGRRGWTALATATFGLLLVGLSAQPGRASELPRGWQFLLLGMVIPVGAIGIFASRGQGRWAAPVLAFGAGLGFAVVSVAARTLHLGPNLVSWVADPGVWALVVDGIAATVLFAQALQKGSATTVAAVCFTTDTVFPSAIGLLFLQDSIRPGWSVFGSIGFVVGIVGAVALAHYSSLAGPPKLTAAKSAPAPAAVL